MKMRASEPREAEWVKLKMFLIHTKYLFGDRSFKRLGCLLKLFCKNEVSQVIIKGI